MTVNTDTLKNNVFAFRVTPQKAPNSNKTPYEKMRLNVLAQHEVAWTKYKAGQQQDWFTKGGLDSSQVYFTIRYGKQPVTEKMAVPTYNLDELNRRVREAIENDAFKDEILAAQARHCEAMRKGRKSRDLAA